MVPRILRNLYQFNPVNRDRWVASQAALVPKGSRVLDAGAGMGPYRDLFAHCEYKTQDFGQEPSTVGKYTELDYVSEITAIPVEDGSFDVVLCTEVLEHVPEPIKAIQEFSRILKTGGLLILTAPLGSRLHQEPYHFYGGFSHYWYEKFLSEAGFDVEVLEENEGFFSHFGQEGIHFMRSANPFRKDRQNRGNRLVSGAVWFLSAPFLLLFFPLIGSYLDRQGLEKTDTVGYHVRARKKRA